MEGFVTWNSHAILTEARNGAGSIRWVRTNAIRANGAPASGERIRDGASGGARALCAGVDGGRGYSRGRQRPVSRRLYAAMPFSMSTTREFAAALALRLFD